MSRVQEQRPTQRPPPGCRSLCFYHCQRTELRACKSEPTPHGGCPHLDCPSRRLRQVRGKTVQLLPPHDHLLIPGFSPRSGDLVEVAEHLEGGGRCWELLREGAGALGGGQQLLERFSLVRGGGTLEVGSPRVTICCLRARGVAREFGGCGAGGKWVPLVSLSCVHGWIRCEDPSGSSRWGIS